MINCSWKDWMRCGDYSYFVSRILLSQQVYLYGRFCAHQMIEAYLKAFLSHANAEVPNLHGLERLLSAVRKTDPDKSSFIHSAEAETTCLIFEPFYEIARYPVQNTRPKDGKYIWISGVDEKILDYFAYHIHQVFKNLDKSWKPSFTEGNFEIDMIQEYNSIFFDIFIRDNLNFY